VTDLLANCRTGKQANKTMKKLLMITYPFPPNASAGAMRSERFARYLPQFGWEVDVVTIKPRQDMFKDTELLAKLGDHVRVHFTRTLDPWLWLNSKKPNNRIAKILRGLAMRLTSFPDHMFFWVPFAIRIGFKIIKEEKIDAIYTTSPPHSTQLAGLALSNLSGLPWVGDFRDPWTFNVYRRHFYKEKGIDAILTRTEKAIERSVLHSMSRILVNTEANKKNLLKAFPFLGEEKVIHLPNGWEEFPAEFYRPGKKGGPLTIVHAGTFYPQFKPYGLLYALAAWQDGEGQSAMPPLKSSDIKVILLGARDEETARIVKQLNISDFVEIRPWVALDDARKIMCQADFLWASLGTGKESGTYIPSKLFEYIAAKRPIIGFFPKGEAERLITETNTGVVFRNDDHLAAMHALWSFLQSKRIKKNFYFPNKEKINKFHISIIVKQLASSLKDLTD